MMGEAQWGVMLGVWPVHQGSNLTPTPYSSVTLDKLLVL